MRSMKNGWLIAVASVLVVALAVLATLQYRWIREIGDADEQRERDAMTTAALHAADEIGREVQQIRSLFMQEPEEELAHRYSGWATVAHDPRLISSIYVVHAWRGAPELFAIDLQSGATTQIDWPPDFEPVRAATDAPPNEHRGMIEELPAIVAPLRPMMPGPRDFGPGPPRGRPEPPPNGELEPMRPAPTFAVLVLDRNALNAFFADTAKRFLDQYDVAVVDGQQVIFRTAAFDPRQADVAEPLLTRTPDGPRPARWILLVHRRGETLADVAAATRRRNLGVSAAVLAILAGAFVLLAVIARRAERLRQQQLAFVAGITHELNTPLAAIESAGENLADGIVVDREHVVRYGGAIVKESRRLSDIVAQVLTYAGMQARGPRRTHEQIDIESLLTTVIASCAWFAEQGEVTIETDIAANLPRIDGDREELSAAVRNLIVNAIRHGGQGHWVGVRAALAGDSVVITIEDRGQGVAARDLPRLFEPFYRGRSAHARGAGLGLAIVKQIAIAHGGSVSAEKRRERGAAFMLRLPAPEGRRA